MQSSRITVGHAQITVKKYIHVGVAFKHCLCRILRHFKILLRGVAFASLGMARKVHNDKDNKLKRRKGYSGCGWDGHKKPDYRRKRQSQYTCEEDSIDKPGVQ
jgi:hypothetical protein